MADFGPVGGGVAALTETNSVETQTPHGLADGDLVSIGSNVVYVKCAGPASNAFSAFTDAALTQPAVLTAPPAGTAITKLALEDHAVVAGINWYPSYTSLRGPVRDATRFAKWLKSEAYVPPDQVKDILSPPARPAGLADAQPTLDRVKREFEVLARKAVQKDLFRLGRRLYIFLSGHGIMPTRAGAPSFNETALLMANADPITLGNHLGGHSYAEWFRAAGVFDEVILFVDCCRDQKDAVALTQPSMTILPPQRQPARNFYAAATQLASPSFEKPLGNAGEVSGVFSYVLMQALESASLCDPAGMLTGKLLASHLYKEVPLLQEGQQPDIDYKPEQDIAFVKRPAPKKPKASISFGAPDLAGKQARLVGKNYPQPDAVQTVNAQPWVVALDPSLYGLDVPGTPYTKKLFEIDGNQEVVHVTFP